MGALLLDEDSFPLTNYNHPKQPDGVSCGVCCLLMLEVLARSPEAFYSLARSGRNFTPNEILTARAKWASALRAHMETGIQQRNSHKHALGIPSPSKRSMIWILKKQTTSPCAFPPGRGHLKVAR